MSRNNVIMYQDCDLIYFIVLILECGFNKLVVWGRKTTQQPFCTCHSLVVWSFICDS